MLQTNDIIDNTYQIINRIGSGGTGDVYLAYHLRLEKYVVIKKIKTRFVDLVNVRAEVDILKRLKHTYLPQVYDFVQHGEYVYTVMDYIDGCDLSAYIKAGYYVDEDTILKWLRQLCEVLVYLHSQNPPIIHSDIKPGNIMITTEGNVCLIDFNISLNGDDGSQISGISVQYASPEQYQKAMLFSQGQEHSYIILDGRSDMYSLAAAFYELMTGREPSKPYETFIPISSWQLTYSEGLISVIDKAMQPNIESRYESMQHMLNAVNTIYKHTRSYKRYLLEMISSSIGYLLIMCIGIWCLIHGYTVNLRERFESEHNDLVFYYQDGGYEEAINTGINILNNSKYENIMESDNIAQIFYVIGNSYFEIDDYTNAAFYFGQAISNVSDIKEHTDYYCDYTVALIRSGQKEKAQEALNMCQEYGMQSTSLDYIYAEMLVGNGNYAEALEKIDILITLDMDLRQKTHILALAGEASKKICNYERQIQYLEKARKIDNSISVLRELGSAYIKYADSGNLHVTEKKKYYELAKECYLDLTGRNYVSYNDYLNLAICYRATGEYRKSIRVLEDLEKEYSDYRIYMHLAFAYDKKEDAPNAIKYAEKAIDLYNKTPDGSKESSGSDNILNLKEIENKYRK